MTTSIPTSTRRAFAVGGVSSLALVTAAATGSAEAKAKKAKAPAQPAMPYKDATLPVETRVADLLGRMTLAEKVMQMQCIWQQKDTVLTDTGDFDSAKAAKNYPDGIGMIARPGDQSGVKTPPPIDATGRVPYRKAENAATLINAMQKWAVEGTRLGIPMFMHEESLHGFVARDATSFPQAIGLASSFDPDLATRIFAVAAREARARGCNHVLAPVVDVAREPRWGRIEETYGEDPHLCGEMGKAAVIGFQGETLPLGPDKVFATLKHMTGHGQPESGTNTGPAEISERTLREDFFPPFEKIVKTTNIRTVMPSYNEIDGVPSHANKWLLTTILRGEWGFKGITVSDYFAIHEMITRHHLVTDDTEAAFRAFSAGVDIETPDRAAYPHLPDLVASGRITEAQVDAVVSRILEVKFLGGLFENPYVDAKKADSLTAAPDAVALAREAATRTPVLLKNGGILPFDAKKIGKLLVLGTHARDCPIGGYSEVPRHIVSILDGLTAESKAQGFQLDYSEGVRLTEGHIWEKDEIVWTPDSVNDKLIADAVAAAKSADTILMVLGDNEQTSREGWADNHLGDRTSLDLIGRQNDLAAQIFALGKPTVVFLLNGRPLSINLLAEKADAIIEGWYMGQETGWAAADILFGRANPGGKLPVSIARNVGQLPIFYNYKPSARRGYLDNETSPLYPFGFGLSYTTFDISAPALDKASIGTADSVNVSIAVTNTGAVKGDEVVQLYIRDDVSSVTRPVKELKHFKRVTLNPGEKQMVTFTVTPADLQFYNADMQRVVEPGTFTLMAGPNSVDVKTAILTVA